ncbi:mpv17-like protein 2 [Lineus longissimus]|uniref:mpv17-like protein 2 n=1 Tax=Lineus longissimus TaxID=88925 RepID=UPI002B4FB46B
MLITIARFGTRLFTKYLLVTNVAFSCGFSNAGDLIVQGMQIHEDKKSQKKLHSNKWVDWERTGNVFKVGALLGVFQHYWYVLLDTKLPGTAGKTMLKKIIADQLVASPVSSAIFVIGISLMEHETCQEAMKGFKEKFPVIYLTDWSFWPVVQGINFRYVQDRYRVMYVNAATLVWTVFLSYVQFVDEKHLAARHENDMVCVKTQGPTQKIKTFTE